MLDILEKSLDKVFDGIDKIADFVDDFFPFIIGVVVVVGFSLLGWVIYESYYYDDGLSYGKITDHHMDNGYMSVISCGKSSVCPYYVPPAFYVHIVNNKKEGEHQVEQDVWMKCKDGDYLQVCDGNG